MSNVFGLMVREFVFVLIQITVCSEITFNEDLCHVETSQLIFNAMQLFGFYMTYLFIYLFTLYFKLTYTVKNITVKIK